MADLAIKNIITQEKTKEACYTSYQYYK